MAEKAAAALVRLMTLLSPAFPVGAFAYSHGIERAIHDGLIADGAELVDWLGDLLAIGSGWNDAVLFAEAWRRARSQAALDDLADLAEAMAGSSERHLETMAQGTAFLKAVAAWPNPVLSRLPEACAYPVAVGAVAVGQGIARETALAAFLHGFTANLVQAAVRLVPLGQTDGVRAIAALEAGVLAAAARASASSLEDLGSATIVSDLTAMRHETQPTRLFRS